MQFEDIVLVDVFRLSGDGDRVAQQGETGQWIVILERGSNSQKHSEFHGAAHFHYEYTSHHFYALMMYSILKYGNMPSGYRS